MNAESPWHPESLGRMTLDQLRCLQSKTPPGSAQPLESMADFEAEMARIEAEEREWYAGRPLVNTGDHPWDSSSPRSS